MISKDDSIIHSTLEEGYDFFITDNRGKKYHFKISTKNNSVKICEICVHFLFH
jgi:hypothetical protein